MKTEKEVIMESQVQKKENALNILLIGNNPIDMSRIIEKINQISGARVMTEIAFDVKSILERLMRFEPNFILIDDNIGKVQLIETIDALSHRNNTKDIPITVLKNSNYEEAGVPGSTILDYLLKTNVSADTVYNAIRNSLKFKKTQSYLSLVYKSRKRLFARTRAKAQI